MDRAFFALGTPTCNPRCHPYFLLETVLKKKNGVPADGSTLGRKRTSQYPETLEHLFVLCDWVTDIWADNRLQLETSPVQIQRIDKWIFEAPTTSPSLPLPALLTNVLWRLWKERNGIVLRGKRPGPELVVDEAEVEVSIFDGGWQSKRASKERREALPDFWIPPSPGQWRFSVDCPWIEGEELGSVAGICTDLRGAIVTGFAKEERADSVLELETLGVLQALRVLKEEKEKNDRAVALTGSVVGVGQEVQKVDILH